MEPAVNEESCESVWPLPPTMAPLRTGRLLTAGLCAATLLVYVWHTFGGAPRGTHRPASPAATRQQAYNGHGAVGGGAMAALAARVAASAGSEPARGAGPGVGTLLSGAGGGSGAAALTAGAGDGGGSAADLSAGLTATRCASLDCAKWLESREPAWVNLTFQPGIDWLGGGVRGDCVAGELEYLWPKYCSPPTVRFVPCGGGHADAQLSSFTTGSIHSSAHSQLTQSTACSVYTSRQIFTARLIRAVRLCTAHLVGPAVLA
jgi:hypothetical protein